MTAQEKYALWCREIPSDTPLGEELRSLAAQPEEILARFLGDLTFGTAGLRGIMGAGTDRMNEYTVRRAALGYGKYLAESGLPKTCAIAYDTRHNSRMFSEVCATALVQQGIHVYLFEDPAPTPVLSFTVRHLKTGGGVVMTASHNPSAYNGMKCYGPDGCQQPDEPAAQVFSYMEALPLVNAPQADFQSLVAAGDVELIGATVLDAYFQAVLGESLCEKLVPVSGLRILYTPLNGTGLTLNTRMFEALGAAFDVVETQAAPDGDFPTCPYPNPETPEAFQESLKLISRPGAPRYDLVIATDPDADRVAVAVPQAGPSGWTLRRLSGNELGCLLLEFILNNRLRLGTLPTHPKAIKSIVTTPMVEAIAAAYGCEVIHVLTGFKYIGSAILKLEQQKQEDQVVFSYEESCGFLKGTYARDKDSIVTCMLVCELAAACKLDGLDLGSKLDLAYDRYGHFTSQGISITLDGEAGKQKCAAFLDKLRQEVPKTLAGMPVMATSDYRAGVHKDLKNGTETKLDFPSSNVFALAVGDRSQVILRPSGTEPKLKLYLFAAADTKAGSQQTMDTLASDVQRILKEDGVTA